MKGAAGNGRNAVQLPLLLTTAIHLGALLLAMFAPRLVPQHLQSPEVYQVELYTAPEVQSGRQPAQPPGQAVVAAPNITAPPPPATVPPKAQTKPTISTPVPPRASPKAVSLSPLKERLVRENREREEQARRNRQLTERVAQLRLDLQQQQAEEKARKATRLAREAIAETYRNTPAVQVSGAAPTRPRGDVAATGANVTPATKWLAAKQLEARAAYVARLREHLRRHWKLPVLQDWDEKLSATMVIKIKRDGSVITSWFEKHSNNSRFDQYVKKAVDRASPLPPLPREFEQNSEEIAVTFTPGGLN